jgi:hypothetical protein
MINNQRRNNQTNQGCVGTNLRVCPAIANSIGISKQTEFSFTDAGTSCKFAPKGTNIRVRSLTSSKYILRFSAYSAGKENNLPQNSQKYAEKDKQGINILLNNFKKNKIR